ncbi:MAG: ATP-binding protein [Bryobacteraceae bacterium]|jgi:hypothetical protein
MNPFGSWIAGDAWDLPEADVGEIGAQSFDACHRAIAVTLAEHRTTAVLIRGEPGSGKTHLMRRLRAHLARSPDERLRETLFVYVRLSTTSNMVWRHLRRRIADDLMRAPADGIMQLELLVYRLLARPGSRGRLLDRLKHDLPAGLPWNERSFARALAVVLRGVPENELAALDFFDRMEGEEKLPPGLVKALRRLVHRQDLSLVRAWLRGDSLTAADLDQLGIAEDSTQESDPEYAAREMVLTLARLAGARMPMVLCFDQVEALETSPGELSGFLAFGGAVSTLHDETTNLVLISCMQSSVETMFRRADYDRIAEQAAHLPLLGRRDALRLINARLEAAGPGLRWAPAAEFESIFNAEGQASARKILAKAAELFDRAHAPASAGRPLPSGSFLQQEWDSRIAAAGESISQGDIDEVLDQGIRALLTAAAGGKWKAASGAGDIDFRLESPTARIDVSLCNQKNMNSLAARLRRLGDPARNGRSARLVLVRDPRLGIGKSAHATRRYLDDLAQAGARVVHPSIEALEALEALRSLLADARSGDLTRDGEPVGPETVQDWIARNMPPCLADLVGDIAGQDPVSPANAKLREDLLALLEERCMIGLEEAAREIGQEASVLRQSVLASPGAAGLLEGPPALLYRLVPTARA